jgi:hypothetical protein
MNLFDVCLCAAFVFMLGIAIGAQITEYLNRQKRDSRGRFTKG